MKRSIDNVPVNCVVMDECLGGRLAAEHLIALGHRLIAFVGPDSISIGRQRLRGFQEALSQAGLSVSPDLVRLVPDFRQSYGYEATKALIEGPRPTAIFAAADVIAEGCYQACAEAHLRIPDDISIVGHDDYSAAFASDPYSRPCTFRTTTSG